MHGHAVHVVPAARAAGGVLHGPAVLGVLLGLPLGLVLDGAADVAHGVDVLDLDDRGLVAVGIDEVHVRLAAQVAFLHVAVRRAEERDDLAQGVDVALGLRGGGHVGLADDLEQRRAGAVEVHARLVAALVVGGLAGVLLEVRAADAHDLGLAVVAVDLDAAVEAERLVVLADLVALREVGIEVVLAVPLRELGDVAAQGESRADGQPDRLAVEHRQCAGQAHDHRVDLRVRIGAVVVGAGGEALRLRLELEVHLHADEHLRRVAHHASPFTLGAA